MRFGSCIEKRIRQGVLAGCVAGALGLAGVGVVRAIETIEFAIEDVQGEGWSAQGILLEFGLPADGMSAQARIAHVRWANATQDWRNVRIACPAVNMHGSKIECSNASVAFDMPALGEQQVSGALAYDRASGDIDFDIRAPRLAGGSARVRGSLRAAGWQARVQLNDVSVEQALAMATNFGVAPAGIAGTGRVSGMIDAAGGDTVERARIVASVAELTANNESGSLASDSLALDIDANLVRLNDGWRYEAQVEALSGQAYAEPVFVDFGVHQLKFQAAGSYADSGEVTAERFAIDHQNVMRADGSARVDLSHEQPLRDLSLDLHALTFPGAYATYFQPLLLDTDFKALETSGRIEGVIVVHEGVPERAAVKITDLHIDDGAGMLALQGVNGQITWRDGANEDDDAVLRAGAERSSLRWSGGSLLNLALGRAALTFTTIGRNFRLVEPTSIPLLDGAIDVESLRVRNAGLPTVAFMVDATIRPISVAQLCRAFGWPEFGGSLSGSISKLRLRDGVVTLGTTLEAQVFDGRVAVKDLRLEDALGKWPRFHSSIELANLDLELVTRAFSFGRITGRLSGEINELELFNWQPIAFDARLYTPPNDRSRHRISQRAVQNIGSIGGGGAGITQALSSGVMKFFDDFGYDKLGLSCRLENEVCHMDGVAPAANGAYYLVKGSGLPRIDVIGSNRRVDWPRLVSQLIAVTEAEGPVVE
jgi:hypothetical protein